MYWVTWWPIIERFICDSTSNHFSISSFRFDLWSLNTELLTLTLVTLLVVVSRNHYAPVVLNSYVGARSIHATFRSLTSAFVNIRQHTSAYVSIRQHTSAYVSIRHLQVPNAVEDEGNELFWHLPVLLDDIHHFDGSASLMPSLGGYVVLTGMSTPKPLYSNSSI